MAYRGSYIKNLHRAHVAIVNETGMLLYSFDALRIALARSAAERQEPATWQTASRADAKPALADAR